MPLTRACVPCLTAFLVSVVAASAGASLSAAQQPTGRVSGTVTDPRGRTVEKVQIVLTHTATGKHHKTRTDAAGRYTLDRMVPGDYEAECTQRGFAPSRAKLSVPSVGVVEWNVNLLLASVLEDVYVSFDSVEGSAGPELESEPEAADPCAKSAAGGCVRPPSKVHHTWMTYPPRLREQKRGGVAEIDAVLGTDGRLAGFKIVRSDDEEFASAAINTMRQWRYHAARLDGEAVEMRARTIFHFGDRRP